MRRWGSSTLLLHVSGLSCSNSLKPKSEAAEQLLRRHLNDDEVRAARRESKLRPKHSGQQKEVLQMYRDCLKEAWRMDDADTRQSLKLHIKHKFREHQNIPRKEVTKIEWLMHYGRTKLDELRAMKPNTKFRYVGV